MENFDVGIVRQERPLLWGGKEFVLVDMGIVNRKPFAKVKPHNPKLVAELKRRLKKDSNITLVIAGGYCYLDEESKP